MSDGFSPEMWEQVMVQGRLPVITDHAEATVAALRLVIGKLEAGAPPEDWGRLVVLLGRMMERRT